MSGSGSVLTQADIDSYKQSARFSDWCMKKQRRAKEGSSPLENYLEDYAEQRAAIMAAEKLEEIARDFRADAAAIARYREQDKAEEQAKLHTELMKNGVVEKLLDVGGMTLEEIAKCVDLPLSTVQRIASKKEEA
ncbi:MAG: hypothetical protein IJR85_06110 [Synergistaceae bacterium]|nr:hypothetical protein [Synergistaceae bacterium]